MFRMSGLETVAGWTLVGCGWLCSFSGDLWMTMALLLGGVVILWDADRGDL